MARILVVGSGFAGLSAAARLAKLRHDVTILERGTEPGGRLLGVPIGDERWAAAPQSVTLPGVFRDLFRKSGRPMDALIEITPAGPRHHVVPARWPRKSVALDLPFGTRGAQLDVMRGTFGDDGWSAWIDELADPWNALRRGVLEVTHDDSPVEPPLAGHVLSAFTRPLRDPRLRHMAADLPGVDPARAPAVLAVWHYVERNFGRWHFDCGSAGLATALLTRLRERKVTIETGTEAELPPGTGPVDGVLVNGVLRPADVVVWAAGSSATGDTRLTAVTLGGATLPDDFVVHDRSVLYGWRSGPNGWVLEAPAGFDPLELLARHGMDVRDAAVSHGSVPAPPLNSEIPLAARTPRPGLWLVGASAASRASLEVTGMGTAALAAELGAVPR